MMKHPDHEATAPHPLPPFGSSVLTACQGTVNFDHTISYTMYHSQWVYFCLSSCKDDFERDPSKSCLGVNIQHKEYS